MTEQPGTPTPDQTPSTPPGGTSRKTLYQRGAIVAVAVAAVVIGVVLIAGGGGGNGTDTDTASNTNPLGATGLQASASPTALAATPSATPTATPSAAATAEDVCSVATTTDPTYKVNFQTTPNPPVVEGTVFKLAIERGGKPVADAKVCMTADMTTMHHPGVESTASETSAGHYQLELELPMRGPWAGSAIIVRPGMPAVAVPVSFDAG